MSGRPQYVGVKSRPQQVGVTSSKVGQTSILRMHCKSLLIVENRYSNLLPEGLLKWFIISTSLYEGGGLLEEGVLFEGGGLLEDLV